jgi:hypothetical protein
MFSSNESPYATSIPWIDNVNVNIQTGIGMIINVGMKNIALHFEIISQLKSYQIY